MRSPQQCLLGIGLLLFTFAEAPSAHWASGGLEAQSDSKSVVDFEPLATKFIADQELDPESLGSVLFVEVLNGPGFCYLKVGAFDIRIPSAFMADKVHVKTIKDAVIALIQSQEHWMHWFLREKDGYEQAQTDLAALEKWAKGWSGGSMKKASRGGNLLELIKPKANLIAAAERLRAFAGPTEDQLFELGEDVGTILLAPTRRFFLEVLGFLGWIDLDRRDFYWRDQSVGITAAWYDWVNVVPLEGSAWPVELDAPFEAQPHSARHKTGLQQFVVDRGAASLLRLAFYRTDFSVFESALRTNLVIATAGHNDLYLADWGLSFGSGGASRGGTSQFIPVTGLPGKGSAAPGKPRASVQLSAKNTPLWRKNKGADNFKEALSRGQKKGGALAAKRKDGPNWKDKLAHFQLASSKSNKKGLARAPFFGQASQRKGPQPTEFKNDYEEFARAYRAAFFHWMREHGASKESNDTFSRLMVAHSDPFGEVTFADMVQKAYGLPLSAENGSIESMEWNFLKWLSK